MKNIKGNFIIELGVLNNTDDIHNLKYGWDWDGGVISEHERRLGTSTSWGMVFNEYDLRHTKLVIKEDEDNDMGDHMAIMAVRYESEDDIRVIGALVEGNTISIAEISVDPADATTHTVTERYESIDQPHGWGLIVEKKGMYFNVYAEDSTDSPEENVLSYKFTRRDWDAVAMGLWALDGYVDGILGYRRIMDDQFNCLIDYDIRWDQRGISTAWVRIGEKNIMEHAERGHKAAIRLVGFEDTEDTDLYLNTIPAFMGLITDVEEKDGGFEFDLKSYRTLLDHDTELVILEDLSIGSVSVRDYFDILEDIYDHFLPLRNFSHPTMTSEWHDSHDRVLSIKGSALNAEQEHLESGSMGVAVQPVDEMTYVDVEVYEVGEGKERVIKSEHDATTQDENIIQTKNIKKLSRDDVYTNLINLSGSAEDTERRIYRSNRFDRLLNLELELDIEKEIELSDFSGTMDEFIDIAKNYLDMQEKDGYHGDIILNKQHHDLGGLYKSGSVTITDTERGIIEEKCRLTSMIINKGNTEFNFTQSPLMSKLDRMEEIRRSLRYAGIESVYGSCEELTLLVWVDDPLSITSENITDIRFESGGSGITDKVEVEVDTYRGYVYIDHKLTPDDYTGEAANPDSVRLYANDGEQVIQLSRLNRQGIWLLNGTLDGDDIESEVHVTIGLMQDLILETPSEKTLTFGEMNGGIGDPDVDGGYFGKPLSKNRIDMY